MDRQPARDYYDVDIQVEGGDDKMTCFANAFVKMTYKIDPGSKKLIPAPALPLVNDLKDETLEPRVPPHSDYWPQKTCTDVGIVGSAYVADGGSAVQLPVSVTVGKRRRDMLVFGERFIEFAGTKPRISEAQPFTSQLLDLSNAYGGIDFRVPFEPDDPQAMSVTLEADHPGMYPRNPWGTGYLAQKDPIEGMRLPSQEDPADLLTADRLIARNPELWFQQPMPAHIGWVPVNCFPRIIFFGIECEPWFPPPDDASLKEVSAGHLAAGYRELLKDQICEPHWRFEQEATPDLMFKNDLHGAPVTLTGLHPEHPVLSFTLPSAAPALKMKIENKVEDVEPLLTSIEIRADEGLVTMTYTASMDSTRPFIPGIHKKIPIALSVNGEKAVPFVAPPTIKQLLADAEANQEKQP